MGVLNFFGNVLGRVISNILVIALTFLVIALLIWYFIGINVFSIFDLFF